jgi:hypothetical protein
MAIGDDAKRGIYEPIHAHTFSAEPFDQIIHWQRPIFVYPRITIGNEPISIDLLMRAGEMLVPAGKDTTVQTSVVMFKPAKSHESGPKDLPQI